MVSNPTLPTENINQVILGLLKIKSGTELDYQTYFNIIKKRLAIHRMVGAEIPAEEDELLREELKRIGKLKDKGRFKIKEKTVKVTGKPKTSAPKTSAPKTGAIIKAPFAGITKDFIKPPVEPVAVKDVADKTSKIGKETNILQSINKTLESILSTLIDTNKQNINESEKRRRSEEEKKRTGRESSLESKTFEGIKKAISTITKPFQSIWDKIVNFITNIILGRIVLKLIDWIADPKNQGKIQSIIRFVKDWWPALLGSYILFGTKFGGLIRFIGGWAVKLAFQLGKVIIPKLLTLIAKNPIAALAVAGGIGAYAATQQNKERRDESAKTDPSIVKPEETAKTGKGPGPLQLSEEQIGQQGLGLAFSGGGEVRWPGFSGGGFNFRGMMGGASTGAMFGPLGMLLGGTLGSGKPQEMFSGFVKGPGGPKDDKVPAMLSDGEFVMSAGAVQKYGVDTLEGMNAAGGGTNKPKVVGGTTYAVGGGFIGKVSHHLKQDEALSSLTKGSNDFIKPGGKSVETGKKWNLITSKTPIHSYIDSVGQPTIGWGSTYYDSILNGKKPVKPGDTIIKSQADNILNTNIMNLGKEYSKKIPTWNKMSEDQKAGVTLVGYNAPYGPIGAYRNLTSALAKGDMVRASTEVQRGGPSPSRISLERKLILSGPKDLSKVNPEPKKPSSSQPEKKSGFNLSNLLGYLPKFQKGGEVPERPLPNISLRGGGMIGENSGSNYGPDGKKLSGPDRQYFSYFAQPGESRYIFTKKATERGAVDQANNIQALLDPRSKAATDVKKSSSSALSSNQRIRSAVKPLPRATPKPIVAGGGMGGRRGSGSNPPRQGTKPPSQSPTHRRGTMTSASAYGIMR